MDEEVCFGKPIIRGTRITVAFVVEQLAAGATMEELVEGYKLTKEDILEALGYAASVLNDEAVRSVK